MSAADRLAQRILLIALAEQRGWRAIVVPAGEWLPKSRFQALAIRQDGPPRRLTGVVELETAVTYVRQEIGLEA